MQLPQPIVWLVVSAVVVAWTVLTIVSAINPDVEVPTAVNGLFMTVAGGAVAMSKGGGRKDGGDD